MILRSGIDIFDILETMHFSASFLHFFYHKIRLKGKFWWFHWKDLTMDLSELFEIKKIIFSFTNQLLGEKINFLRIFWQFLFELLRKFSYFPKKRFLKRSMHVVYLHMCYFYIFWWQITKIRSMWELLICDNFFQEVIPYKL